MKPYRPRLFAGIALEKRVRARCAEVSARLQASALDARYEPPEKLHITLAFLGSVPGELAGEAAAVLERAAARHAAFTFALDRLGAFPSERRPRVVWLGAREQGAPFRALAQDVREGYAALGFTFEKPAVAHVTLARVKGGHAHLPLLEVAPIPVRVKAIVLFESLRANDTTHYQTLASAKLAAAV